MLDCQAVVMLRMLRLAEGGRIATRESARMVTEKLAAVVGAQIDAAAALPRGGLDGATAAMERHYRRAVARNRRRLSG
jgi:hypothetical protein